MTNRVKEFYRGDTIDHPHCCTLRAAAEADLESAWEVREGTKAITEHQARRSAALSLREADVSQRERAANDRDAAQFVDSWLLALGAVVELIVACGMLWLSWRTFG